MTCPVWPRHRRVETDRVLSHHVDDRTAETLADPRGCTNEQHIRARCIAS